MRVFTTVSLAVLATALLAAPEAMAQRNRNGGSAGSVVTVNFQRVLAESALGRDLQTKLQGVRTTISQEAQALAPEGQSIEQEQQRLATTLRNQTQDQLRANPQVQALATRAQQFQQRRQALEGDLQCTQGIALRDFNNVVTPVLQSITESRGAGVAIDVSSTSWSSPSLDVTQTVIQQLDQNASTRTANVARHAVSECQAQAPAAAPH